MQDTLDHNSQFWVVLTFGDDRKYGGNQGYSDRPTEYYLYERGGESQEDRAGDWLIACDKYAVLGIGRISAITETQATKIHPRCPGCDTSKFEIRTKMRPAYRCGNGHTFDSLLTREDPCKHFKRRVR